MITKELIFYFIRKIIRGFKSEWRLKLKKVTIVVDSDTIQIDSRGGDYEDAGVYFSGDKLIVYHLEAIKHYISDEKDIYKAIKKVEKVVEHELLHAVGLDHKEIEEYQAETKS